MTIFQRPEGVETFIWRQLPGRSVEFLLMLRPPGDGGFWQGISGGAEPPPGMSITF